ncbi:hypothetical protein MKOR_39460 [Mycolicibacillus koreensis]|nr:hypothetical protein MKOR_39460 [Mycolicibacillus koreensis]
MHKPGPAETDAAKTHGRTTQKAPADSPEAPQSDTGSRLMCATSRVSSQVGCVHQSGVRVGT